MSVITDPPRETSIDFKTVVLRTDPLHYARPEPQYEFSNGKVFYDRPVDPRELNWGVK
jgi:hypothetical protein